MMGRYLTGLFAAVFAVGLGPHLWTQSSGQSAAQSGAQSGALVAFSDTELALIQSFGPWPPAFSQDKSNRVSGEPRAIALGEALFGDPGLSGSGTMACASCHNPNRDFSEDRARSMGRVLLDRNAPALVNLAGQRWYGWAGDADSLWAHNILPLLSGDEMDATEESLGQFIRSGRHTQAYWDVFGNPERHSDREVLVNVSKSLSAFLEVQVTGRTSFDGFRDALVEGNTEAAQAYGPSALRGLKIFVGSGQCVFCHNGPTLSNGEFHDAGVGYFLDGSRVDTGRLGGLRAVIASPFNLAGDWSDDPEKSGAWAVNSVRRLPGDFGKFRVPSLRGLTRSAPYMHNGSLPTLRSVVDHYNTIDIERLHADGEAVLRPMGLNNQQIEDVVAFLKSLSDDEPR